jgi:hypothetical protein
MVVVGVRCLMMLVGTMGRVIVGMCSGCVVVVVLLTVVGVEVDL